MKYTIEIEVANIEVEETSKRRGWYSFDYSYSVNGKRPKKGNLDGSWSSQTKKEFQSVLKRNWAAQLVIQRFLA
jgi:hypothetical protein